MGDVLLAIDGHDIGERRCHGWNSRASAVLMSEVAERKSPWRHRLQFRCAAQAATEPVEVKVDFNRAWPFLMQANSYDLQPAYVLFGGLLFQPLCRNLMATYQFQHDRINYYYDNFVSKELYKDHPELIVLSSILPDPLNTYLSEFRRRDRGR